METHNRRVVVTGMGTISAIGLDMAEMWDSVVAGKSGIDYISSFDNSPFETKFAAAVKDFRATDYVSHTAPRRMDRFTQFAAAAALQAAESAGLTIDAGNTHETGVFLGNSVCGLLEVCDQFNVLSQAGPKRVSPILAPTMIGDAAPVQVSLLLGIKGRSYSVSSACTSSSDAIGQAFEAIQRGKMKVILAGGTEAPIMPICIAAFNSARALSTRNGTPRNSCRPFDRERDGFVLGEGAAVLVLEEMEHALERGARILTELIGYSSTSDAFHITAPSPNGAGATMALLQAFENSGINPEEVDYINAHGTATVLNDAAETQAIKNAFGEAAYRIPISSTKSMTGHLLGAGGALEAAITIMAIRDGVVPPTMNLDHPDPSLDLDYVPNQARKADIRTAISNSFGFGGHNAVLVFRQFAG